MGNEFKKTAAAVVSGGNSRFLVGISVSGESMSQNAPILLRFGDNQVYTILY